MIKRLILICFAITALMPAFGQSVLGIPFGTSYDETRDALRQRFGRFSVDENQGNLEISDVQIGGFRFKFGELMFQYSGSRSYLSSATFQTHFGLQETELAKRERDYLYSLVSPKYESNHLEEFISDEGFKCYKFGINPKDPNKVLGCISLQKLKGKDGIKRLYLILEYFPIEFVPFSSDF